LYCAFHFSALAGVPVTIPVRRQNFCLLQRRCDLIRAQAAQADEGKAEFPVCIGSTKGRRQRSDERQADGSEGAGLDKFAAGGEEGIHKSILFAILPTATRKMLADRVACELS